MLCVISRGKHADDPDQVLSMPHKASTEPRRGGTLGGHSYGKAKNKVKSAHFYR
jgi:hypothetical protein